MRPKNLFITAIFGGAVTLLLNLPSAWSAAATPLVLARAPTTDVIQTAPPVEIRQVAPPAEIRQVAPSEDMRKVAPPRDVGQKPAGDVPTAAAETGLQLGSLGLSSANPKVGEQVFVTANLRNKGNRNLSGVRVVFFLNQVQVGEKVVEVSAGGSATASLSFKVAQAGAQNLRVQVDPGSGLSPLVLARGLTVTGAAKTDVEDFTTPAKKPAAEAKLTDATKAPVPPQRIPFVKPLLAQKGTEIARQPGGPSGSPPGSNPPGGDKDPTGGWGDKHKLKGVPDTTPWGGGGGVKPDLGDGIEGLHDQGDMPKKQYWQDIPDWRQLPGQKTTGHGWGKDQYGQPIFKTPGERGKDISGVSLGHMMYNKATSDVTTRGYVSASGYMNYDSKGNASGFTVHSVGEDGTVDVYSKDKDGKVTRNTVSEKEYELAFGRNPKTSAPMPKKPRPDGDSKETGSPKEIFTDPLLVMKWIKAGPTEGPRGDPQVSDPVPVKGGKAAAGPQGGAGSPAKGGELAAAGAVRATAKWRFSGRKPGSGVTDPAEWQDRKIRDFSFARMKHFEVIDPPEAAAIQDALEKAGPAAGAAAKTVTVAQVAGSVQRLSQQNGQQGWAPLKAGDQLSQGSIIRVEGNTGGEVGFSSPEAALSLNFTKIHGGSKHTLYLVKTTAK